MEEVRNVTLNWTSRSWGGRPVVGETAGTCNAARSSGVGSLTGIGAPPTRSWLAGRASMMRRKEPALASLTTPNTPLVVRPVFQWRSSTMPAPTNRRMMSVYSDGDTPM